MEFYRTAFEEDKAKCKSIKSQAAKQVFRDEWQRLNITNVTAKAQSSATDKQTRRTSRVYKNYWKMVEAEGGLMNREFAMEIATNINTACEAKGAPCVLWDPVKKCKVYIHGEEGIDDEFITLRKLVVQGDVDLPQETLLNALNIGEKEGFTAEIPHDAVSELEQVPAIQSQTDNGPDKEGVGLADAFAGVGLPTPAAGVGLPTPAAASGQNPHAASIPLMATVAAELANKSGGNANQSLIPLMMQALVQSATPQQTAADQDKDKEPEVKPEVKPAAPKPKPKPKKKMEVTLFTECNFGGRKLDGMIRHAQTIIKQASEPEEANNDWHWARDECRRLQSAVDAVTDIAYQSQGSVQTSSIQEWNPL